MDDAIQFESDEPISVEVEPDEPKVTVLVEAAQMEAALPHEPAAGGACAPDIEFQTADTARLDPTLQEAAAEVSEDTLEIKPQFDHSQVYETVAEVSPAPVFTNTSDKSMNETITRNQPTRPRFSDALLDLDEADFGGAIADDVVLDLDLDEPTAADYQTSPWSDQKVEPAEAVVEPEPVEAAQESSAVTATTDEPAASQVSAVASPAAGEPELSAEAINAIARRVIEQMSDSVVREIAWQVVPELSELMIKKKLDQK
jgi:hypothetical protein